MTTAHEEQPVRCSTPIAFADLADYWAGLLPSPREEEVELHLLECDWCGAQLRDVISLAEGVRAVAREGHLRMVVSDTFLQRAAEHGVHVRAYAAAPGESIQCTVNAEDDILVARLAADLSGTRRVDLRFCDERGVEQGRLVDIPVHAGRGGVTYQESVDLLKGAPSFTMIARLVAVDDDGAERLLGEYTFNHTRTLPGESAWS